MAPYQDYELYIRDIGLWDSAGEGETLWVIQIDGLPTWFVESQPRYHYDPDLFAIYLTEEEVEQLGLEEKVRGGYEYYSELYGKTDERALEEREVRVSNRLEFFEKYNVPQRVRNILERLPEQGDSEV
jgi:hypothetical protein